MGTNRNKECERIEEEVRSFSPSELIVECQQDFDSKDYIIWLTIGQRSYRACITSEMWQDDTWHLTVQGGIDQIREG